MRGMDVRIVRRWLVGLAMLPLLAGLEFAGGARYFVCAGDSVARLACCCPDRGPLSPDAGARLSAACCCDVSQASAPTVPAVASSRESTGIRSDHSLPVVASVDLIAFAVPPRTAMLATRTQHPPPLSVPILLQKQSFLV